MRLICPNCGAQYEIPDGVIPENGRDVQCSNCGDTWFQQHPDQNPDVTTSDDLGEPAPPEEWDPGLEKETTQEPVSDSKPEPEVAAAPEPEPQPEPVAAPREPVDQEPDVPLEATVPTNEPQRRALDPEVADLLRQEAEQEKLARAAEAQALESQPDLGLDNADQDEATRRAREAQERMARMRGETAATASAEAAAVAAAASSRRDLLPDIDEINSTLRASNERRTPVDEDGAEYPEPEPQKGGFRSGFLLMILIAIIAVCVYLYAAQISAALPMAEPWLNSYVAAVDAGRAWLDAQLSGVLSWLDSKASENTDGS